MRVGDNYVIFKTNKLFEDKVKIQGRHIYFDPSFEPWQHVRIYGEVVQVPLKLRKIPIMQWPRGVPDYVDFSPFEYKYLSDIPMVVKPGDRIYTHFNTVLNFKNIVKEIPDPENPNKTIEWWYKVRYDQILCGVRDGQILPVGSYVLVEPDMETEDDILIPIAVMGGDGKPLRDATGAPILKPKDQWLRRKPRPTEKYLRGFVRHVGEPLNGDVCEISMGQLIYYRVNADWKNIIEGKEYFVIRQKHIVGRVEKQLDLQ
jgi:hypothetical protein